MFECLLCGGALFTAVHRKRCGLCSPQTPGKLRSMLWQHHMGYHDGSNVVGCIREDLSKEATTTQRVGDEEAVIQRKEKEFSRDKEF